MNRDARERGDSLMAGRVGSTALSEPRSGVSNGLLMRIREATLDDIPQMHRIRMSVRENALTDPGSIQPHHYRALLDAGGRGWVAELDDRIVGFAVADIERAQVWALFVDPDREGLGIGRRLHDVMLAWLFDRGLDRVWLTTTRDTRAERFYRAAGWHESGVDPSGEVRFEMTRPATAPPA